MREAAAAEEPIGEGLVQESLNKAALEVERGSESDGPRALRLWAKAYVTRCEAVIAAAKARHDGNEVERLNVALQTRRSRLRQALMVVACVQLDDARAILDQLDGVGDARFAARITAALQRIKREIEEHAQRTP